MYEQDCFGVFYEVLIIFRERFGSLCSLCVSPDSPTLVEIGDKGSVKIREC